MEFKKHFVKLPDNKTICVLLTIHNSISTIFKLNSFRFHTKLLIFVRLFTVWYNFDLQVYDLYTDRRLATHCGDNDIFVAGESDAVRVVFRTDGSVSAGGWVLTWAGESGQSLNSSGGLLGRA